MTDVTEESDIPVSTVVSYRGPVIERRCQCGAVLSRYNKLAVCGPCERRRTDTWLGRSLVPPREPVLEIEILPVVEPIEDDGWHFPTAAELAEKRARWQAEWEATLARCQHCGELIPNARVHELIVELDYHPACYVSSLRCIPLGRDASPAAQPLHPR